MNVNEYIEQWFVQDKTLLERVNARLNEHDMPHISIDLAAGQMLQWLIRLYQPESALEIGALGGYSGALICQAMGAKGRLVSLELKEEYAAVAHETLQSEGLGNQVEYRIGEALETMEKLSKERATFDLIFIDADKKQYSDYLDAAIRLSTSGTVILADNVLRRGKVLDENDASPQNENMQAFNKKIAAHPQLDSFLFPVGDGIVAARVK
ncbi:O-methyltransferase [Litoribacterium kuwaitense]|uniref:O-methyltransferase n=1 Tax=Litoribacterium kuwaitense TaxID=1398745 RepID=UPI0028B1CD60|nr:O-methyltransferase [Litoribacterium kuwaitense]